jgi:prevent-host-death family protein
MSERVSAAKAKADLSNLVSRVAYGRERFLIERHGRPVAALVSPEDLVRLEENLDEPVKPRGALALIGTLAGIMTDEEIDADLRHIESSRSYPRPFEWPKD